MSKKTSFQFRFRGILVNVTIDRYSKFDKISRIEMESALRRVLARDTQRKRKVVKPAKIQPKSVKGKKVGPRKQAAPSSPTVVRIEWNPSMPNGVAPRLAPVSRFRTPLIQATPPGRPRQSPRVTRLERALERGRAEMRDARNEARRISQQQPTAIRRSPVERQMITDELVAIADREERRRLARERAERRMRSSPTRGGR